MENITNESLYLIDLSYALSPADIVFELSTIIEKEMSRNQNILLKISNVDLNQSQLLSIKSLINSINSELMCLSTESKQTELAAVTVGINVKYVDKAPVKEEPSTQYVPMTEHLDEEDKAQESQIEPEDEIKEVSQSFDATKPFESIEIIEQLKLESESKSKEEPLKTETEYTESKTESEKEDSKTIDAEEVLEKKEVIQEETSIEKEQEKAAEPVEPSTTDNEQIQKQLDSIFDSEMKLESIFGTEKETFVKAEGQFEIEIPEDEELTEDDFAILSMDTKYIKQTVRSGQIVKYDGNLIIIGDCHPGSEIYAQGDITVWGSLSGIAHAGCKGNVKARIRALNLNAIQLRIGEAYARKPDMPNTIFIDKSNTVTPEEARVVNNNIVILKLND